MDDHTLVPAAGLPAQVEMVRRDDDEIEVGVMLRRDAYYIVDIHIRFASEEETHMLALRKRQDGADPGGILPSPHPDPAGNRFVPVVVRDADHQISHGNLDRMAATRRNKRTL